MNEVCADLIITRPDRQTEEEPEYVPTRYPRNYVLNARFMWNKHGLFPNGKCYDDQDPALIDDIERLNARYNYHVGRLKELSGKEWSGDDEGDNPFGGEDDTPATTLDQIRG